MWAGGSANSPNDVSPAVASHDAATRQREAEILAEGKQIALRAKAELGKNLMQALADGGAVSAIEFCNVRALPITEQVSREQGASIKRVSDQPRNPANLASSKESGYIAGAKASLAAGDAPAPALHELEGRWVAYYPILTDGMCLQCHGTPGKQVAEETLSALGARYPDDQATGYGANELRGIWVITLSPERVEVY